MSWFSPNNNKTEEPSAGPGPSWLDPAWRNEKVENPFDDSKVRHRIAELIIRSVLKPEKLGA